MLANVVKYVVSMLNQEGHPFLAVYRSDCYVICVRILMAGLRRMLKFMYLKIGRKINHFSARRRRELKLLRFFCDV